MTTTSLYGQHSWSLQDCVNYAVSNNISIQQSNIDNEEQEVILKMKRNEYLPSISANAGDNLYFGRGPSRDGTYTDNNQMSASFGLIMSLNLFNGFRDKYNIDAQKLNLMASVKDTDQLKYDVTINVTSSYLQVLFCKELLGMAKRQLEISEKLVERTQLLYSVGKKTDADIAEAMAAMSKDKFDLIQCENDLKMALLELVQLINLKDYADFDIKTPNVGNIDTSLFIPSSQTVYDYALVHHPMILSLSYKISSSHKAILAAKSSYYPTINLSGGYNNSYYYSYVNGYNNQSFIDQMRNNGNEYIGISMSIPIFSKLSTKNQVKIAKLNESKLKLNLIEATNILRNNIEKANLSAISFREKYTSSKETVRSMQEVMSNEQKKYDVGKTTIFNYIEATKQLRLAESEMLKAKYEFIFKAKILAFYKGEPINFVY